MKVAVGLRRVAAGKRTSGRRAAQIAFCPFYYYNFFLLNGKSLNFKHIIEKNIIHSKQHSIQKGAVRNRK